MQQGLIIIDLIEDIVGENDGKSNTSFAQVQARQIITHANKAAQLARSRHIPVIWVKVGFADDYHDIPPYSPMFNRANANGALMLSGSGCNWVKGLDVQSDDIVFIKKAVGAFAGNDLDKWPTANKIEHLYLGGVSSAMAIESTSRLAHDLGYKVTILDDLCAAATLILHQQSMHALQGMAEITSTIEWQKNG